MINNNGAKGFGHAGLLIEKGGSGNWTYYSVSNKGEDGISEIVFSGVICDVSSLDNINQCINDTKRQSGISAKYNEMHYIYGFFSVSCIVAFRTSQIPKKYNLLTNNCLQNASQILTYGIFSGEYAEDYSKAMNCMTGMTIPNSASFAFYHFESNIKWYSLANIFQKLFVKDLYYYFYNSIYFDEQ